MIKLFILNINSSKQYIDQLNIAYSIFKDCPENTKLIDANQFKEYFLENIDIVIANKLPNEVYKIIRRKKIVIITIDKYQFQENISDIYIDYLQKEKRNDFFGKSFKITKNKESLDKFKRIFNLISLLSWDTNFWGFPVSLITSRRLTKNISYRVNLYLKINNIKLVQYLCDCHDRNSVEIVEKNKYQFKDIRSTFEKTLNKPNNINKFHQGFRKAFIEETQYIQNMAESLYLDSRYYFDKNFDRKKVQEFYMEWIYKAIHQTYDDDCFVICRDDQPVGYCTLKYLNKKEVAIGLFGVHKNFSGQGLGKILIKNVFKHLENKDYERIIVVTQGRNYAAQRLYQKVGFQTSSTELWYHKWLK